MNVQLKIFPGSPAYFLGQDMRIVSMLVDSAEIRVGANGQLETYYKSAGENPILIPENVCSPNVESILESLLPVEMAGAKVSIVPATGNRNEQQARASEAKAAEVVHEAEISSPGRRTRSVKAEENGAPSMSAPPVRDADDGLFKNP